MSILRDFDSNIAGRALRLAIFAFKIHNMTTRDAFKTRANAEVGETLATTYVDAFYAAYNSSFPFDGESRKAYFFDTATIIEQGGAANENVMIGSYESSGQFRDLSLFTAPATGELKTFTKGGRTITAIMFPTAPVVTRNTTIGGFSGLTASQMETLLGLQPGDITNFQDNGSKTAFLVGVNYEIPAGAFANTGVQKFIDTDSKVTKINSQAFFSCNYLTDTVFDGVIQLDTSAFDSCPLAVSHSFAELLILRVTAIYGNEVLQSLSLPKCTTLGSRCLGMNTSLATLSTPLVTTLGDNVFEYCAALMSIELPSLTTISSKFAFTNWGGPGYTLTVPSALASDAAVVSTANNGTTVILI